MTVDPRLQLTPGEYLIHPDRSASKVVDKRNMTVDEILATGKYTDRRGREWVRCPINCCLNGGWFSYSAMREAKRRSDWHPFEAEMRLLIERDQHRDVCPGIRKCNSHPVPRVFRYNAVWSKLAAYGDFRRDYAYDTLPEAMDAARALAVGE